MKSKNILRRLLSICLSLLLIVSIICVVPVSAMGTTEVVFGETIGEVGNEIVVSVSIKNNPGIASFRFKVCYDVNNFEFISVTEGTNLVKGTFSNIFNAQSKTVTFQWFSDENIYGDGELVQLRFKALEKSPGEHQLNVTYLENDIVNEDLQTVPFDVNIEKIFVFCEYSKHKFSLNNNNTCSICKFSKAPGVPVLESKTDTVVTLIGTKNYEYSKDGSIWQSSNVFTGLLPDTNYTFYQRVAKTDNSFLSDSSFPLSVATYKVCEVDPSLHIYVNDCDTDCDRCGIIRTITHKYEWITDKVNNCGVNGAKHEECSVCHETRNENTVIPATGNHIYDNDCDTNCNVCDTFRTITHKYEWITDKVNNCGVNGAKHEECSVCHETRNENTVIPATGNHNYDNDCDTNCNVCNAFRTITHKYEWITDKVNNCGVNGSKHEECSVCHETRNENTVIPATGNHIYDNACDTDCNVCEQTRTVPDHNYGDDTICDECGYKNYTPGDIDNDGIVKLTDIVALAQYVAEWDIECNLAALDTNGDGNVDLTDIVNLAQYIAGWDVVLH